MEIEYRLCRHCLGETDDDFAQDYVNALNAALEEAYPDADIEINFNSDFANESQIIVLDADDGDRGYKIREKIAEIANLVWDRM